MQKGTGKEQHRAALIRILRSSGTTGFTLEILIDWVYVGICIVVEFSNILKAFISASKIKSRLKNYSLWQLLIKH